MLQTYLKREGQNYAISLTWVQVPVYLFMEVTFT